MGHKRTVIVGDFNMNPFEIPMIKANGFHATMSAALAKNMYRKVQNLAYEYFYNPMWGLLGDLNSDAAGTYYYSDAQHVSYHWNIFDQVIMRPSVIDNFDKNSLRIIEGYSKKRFTTESNFPNSTKFSDHLPIFFTFKI